jgi:transcriptional regulator with XRE-family HTH domain
MSQYTHFEPHSIGQALRQQRKARHLTQKQLAESLGVRRQTIAELESGQNVGSHLLLNAMTYFKLDFDLINLDHRVMPTDIQKAARGKPKEIFEVSEKFDLPYDWPNPGSMPDDVLIMKVLKRLRFADIARLCKRFGVERIDQEIKSSFYDDVRDELMEVMDIIHEAIQQKTT